MQADPGLKQLRNGYHFKTGMAAAINKVKLYVTVECKRQHMERVGSDICKSLAQITRWCTRANDSKIQPSAEFIIASWANHMIAVGTLEGSLADYITPNPRNDNDDARRHAVAKDFITVLRRLLDKLSTARSQLNAQDFRKDLHRGMLNLAASENSEEVRSGGLLVCWCVTMVSAAVYCVFVQGMNALLRAFAAHLLAERSADHEALSVTAEKWQEEWGSAGQFTEQSPFFPILAPVLPECGKAAPQTDTRLASELPTHLFSDMYRAIEGDAKDGAFLFHHVHNVAMLKVPTPEDDLGDHDIDGGRSEGHTMMIGPACGWLRQIDVVVMLILKEFVVCSLQYG